MIRKPVKKHCGSSLPEFIEDVDIGDINQVSEGTSKGTVQRDRAEAREVDTEDCIKDVSPAIRINITRPLVMLDKVN